MVERRIVVLLVDGMGDVALPQLDDATPLQVADTPLFDAVAGASSLHTTAQVT
jgi:2,3-bisphosphoglycerate-independent phosphoglycerate mutase